MAQTTLRSVIGTMDLEETFEKREQINQSVVSSLNEAAISWGVKLLRYEIKDLTPPVNILKAMEEQITAEREKRSVGKFVIQFIFMQIMQVLPIT